MLTINSVAPTIMEFGSDEQKQRFLPEIVRGEIRWCQGYSEPNAGSDLAGLQTSAEDAGDHFVVNGQKVWTSYADQADWIFCLVRTDRTTKQGGISFVLLTAVFRSLVVALKAAILNLMSIGAAFGVLAAGAPAFGAADDAYCPPAAATAASRFSTSAVAACCAAVNASFAGRARAASCCNCSSCWTTTSARPSSGPTSRRFPTSLRRSAPRPARSRGSPGSRSTSPTTTSSRPATRRTCSSP